MVTKLNDSTWQTFKSLILAKIHMVTKHALTIALVLLSLILAKIHMVTKQSEN